MNIDFVLVSYVQNDKYLQLVSFWYQDVYLNTFNWYLLIYFFQLVSMKIYIGILKFDLLRYLKICFTQNVKCFDVYCLYARGA